MKTKVRRRRLSAEDAREAILAATEKRLREIGPDALRLQDIAQDVGMSHPTVLHHIGTREALVSAVVARSLLRLESELIACFTPGVGPTELITTLHQVDHVMRQSGQARLVAWLALTEATWSEKDSRLADVATALHAARNALGKGGTFEDTGFAVLLASTAMFGLALLGPKLLAMMGLPGDEPTMHRFREQLGTMLLEHAGIPLPPATPTARGEGKARRRPH